MKGIEKIFEVIGADKLDESQQESVKEKLEIAIETKAQEKVDSILEEKEEQLIQTLEEKFEEYKKETTSKFSNFVDDILEEEMHIPENISKYAKKGELYNDVIEQLKIMIGIDEGVIDEVAQDLLKEAQEEIINLREELSETIKENIELKDDAINLSSALYIREKCDGLTETQKSHIINILEGLTDKEEIDNKFDIILESLNINEEDDEDEEEGKNGKGKYEEDDEDEEEDEEEVNESLKRAWTSILNRGSV